MSLRCLALRLSKHAWQAWVQHVRGGARTFNPLEGARRPAAPRPRRPLDAVWWRARRALIGDAFDRLANDVRTRFHRRLFYGESAPAFALIGLSLAATRNGASNEDNEQEVLCCDIRDVISKYPWQFDFDNPNHQLYEERVSLKDLTIGDFISKGSCGVVYSAKINDDTPKGVNLEYEGCTSKVVEHPLALKIMFNYDIQSSSMAILNAMYRETIPAQKCRANEQISYWRNLFQKEKLKLPPHPNIVAIYDVFADFMPNLDGSMDVYPDALPRSFNPNGSGRNMTLFLLMKRYQCSLREYLKDNDLNVRDSVLLLAQLLEGIVHINRHGVAHRDLKSDNLLIDEIKIAENCFVPSLAITDFGCCLADVDYGLKLPYKSEVIDKGGNISLMAPEIILQQPGMFNRLDYSKSDLWAAGAIAYEIFGIKNPFVVDFNHGNEITLSNIDYKESDLPPFTSNVPLIIQRLIKNLLSRNPTKRLSPEIAANVCELHLWAPSSWIYSKKMPNSKDVSKMIILEWLICLTTKIICEGRLFNRCSNIDEGKNNSNPDFVLMASFLSRVRLSYVKDALLWIQSAD